MRITALEVDGFGVWSNLKLGALSEGLNVFYGPNEAGKTTLLQFVRAVLYGFSPARRRYLPPLGGGRPGGSLQGTSSGGRFQVCRYDNPQAGGQGETVAILGPDGTRQGEHLLKSLLSGVDETIFNNVFAVGLRDLQELGTLGDTEAAAMLYNLSVGLDRVSLVEVMRELERSRNRILDQHGGSCQVTQLLAQREKLRAEVDDQAAAMRRYSRLAAERDQVDREASRLEEETRQLVHETRVVEIALAQLERWQRRTALDEQLAALGPVEMIPEGTLERLAEMSQRLKTRQESVVEVRGRQEEVRLEVAELELNENLWRMAPRVEALKEQEGWVSTLQRQVGELETEIGQLESQLAAEQQRFGLGEGQGGGLSALSSRSLMALRYPAKAVSRYRRQMEEAKQEVARARETAHKLAGQVEAALASRGERNLTQAMDRIGGLVTQLRRRVQLDERIEQMTRHQVELDEQSHRLLQRQMLPMPLVAGLGGLFVVGLVLGMAGLFGPASLVGSMGWPLAVLGAVACITAGVTKVILERTNAQRLENCQKQVNLVQLQLKQSRQERDVLDEQLPQGGGPMVVRLQAAEKELALLEDLVPQDARRQAAQQEAEAAAERVRQAEQGLAVAQRRWRDALAKAGLPSDLTPKQARDLVTRCDDVADTQRRLDRRYEEFQQRTHELEALKTRIVQLAADCRVTLGGTEPIGQIRELAEALGEQETRRKRRDALRGQVRQLRRKRMKLEAAIDRMRRRRRGLLREAGVSDEDTLRHRVAEIERTVELRRERLALSREIEAAIAGCCTEAALGEQLKGTTKESLESRREQLERRWQTAETELQKRFEARGRLGEQLKSLVDDRTSGRRQLELAVVEKRLGELVDRWRTLAVTNRVLERIRKTYEEDRQPETLQEASRYLSRMTEGRYRRVWTPLGEDVLVVDDAQGRGLSIDVLSQGTREQLFLSLRMALASSYARRGVTLPMVLDDVLVNFDAQRAKAAAGVLAEFAQGGRQLLVFTCHEHIVSVFAGLQVRVTELPHGGPRLAMTAPVTAKAAKKTPKRPAEPEPVPEPQEEPQDLITETVEPKRKPSARKTRAKKRAEAKKMPLAEEPPKLEKIFEPQQEIVEETFQEFQFERQPEEVVERRDVQEDDATTRGLSPWEEPWGDEPGEERDSVGPAEHEEIDEEEVAEIDEVFDEVEGEDEEEDLVALDGEDQDDGDLFAEDEEEEGDWDDEDDFEDDEEFDDEEYEDELDDEPFEDDGGAEAA